MIYIYIIAIFVPVLILLIWLSNRTGSQWLQGRNSHPKLWQCAFTDEAWPKADEALYWICDSFSLPHGMRHALRPSDVILGIYRRYYPRPWMADGMEYEELAMHLEEAGHDPTILNRSHLTVRDLVVLHAGCPGHNKEETEQAVPSDRNNPSSHDPSDGPTTPADAH